MKRTGTDHPFSVFIHLATGFEEIEAITIIDVLRRADIGVTTVSITGHREVTGAHEIIVHADLLFEDADYGKAGMIVLPGGMPGAKNLSEHEGLAQQIVAFHTGGKWLGAICAAPLVFGKLGIVKGKEVTCYPGFEKYLEGAHVTGKNVTCSGTMITAKGPGAAIPFALKIVEMVQGKNRVDSLKEKMIVA
jgi:protein deglycase